MKFKSDPGRVLTDSRTHRVIGKFDGNGIFETDDPYYTPRLKLLFPVIGPGGGKRAAKENAAEKDTAPKAAAKKDASKKVKA